jgi:hypothetical protein
VGGECGSYDGELGDGGSGGVGLGDSSDDENCGMRVEGQERSAVGTGKGGAYPAMGSSAAAIMAAWGSASAATTMSAACGRKWLAVGRVAGVDPLIGSSTAMDLAPWGSVAADPTRGRA